MFLIAQIFGILVIVSNVLSMQMKQKRHMIIMFMLANLFSTFNFILLHSYSGAFICFLSIIQIFINYFFERKQREIPKILIGTYIIISIICGLITFKNCIDILPIMSSILYTLSIVQKEEKNIRKIVLLNSVLWTIYEFTTMAYTAGMSDAFMAVSTIIGMYRFDYKKSINIV